MIETIINPDLYHGKRKNKNFFEGWYFKIVDKDNKNVLAFIPGIYKSTNSEYAHSFIQVLIGNESKYEYIKYDVNAFKSEEREFSINIQSNRFSLNGFNVNISTNNMEIKGDIKFSNIIKWKDSILNPGSMGFYNYLLFMECYSQVCVLDGSTTGKITINEKTIDFEGGKVYIEKNWGAKFPKSWIWVQSNSFTNTNRRVSLTCSIGTVPFLFGSFSGFLTALKIHEKSYKFTSINRSKLKINRREEDVSINFDNKNYILNLTTFTNRENFMLLMGPRKEGMVPLVNETLTAKVKVELICKSNKEILFSDFGYCTGVEYGGERMFK